MAKGSSPLLSLVPKTSVQIDYSKEDFHMPSLPKREKSRKKGLLLHVLVGIMGLGGVGGGGGGWVLTGYSLVSLCHSSL